MEERYLSLSEAADALDISERTAYRWIKSGKLKAYKPGRDYRIPESALRELVKESEVYPKGSGRSSLEPSLFDDVLEGDRRLRYLRVSELFAAAMNRQWSDRVERDLFSEEDFEHGVHTFGDFEGAYVTGIGTGLLAALRMDAPALPAVELEALEHAQASIGAWHSTMWRAYERLQERGPANVTHLDAYRAHLQASRFEKAELDAARRDVTA